MSSPTVMGSSRESKFRRNVVIPFLKKLPKTFVFTIQQLSMRGTPDLIICINSFFVVLELKRTHGRVAKIQEWTIEQAKKAGGIGYIAHPGNWEHVSIQLKVLSEMEIK